MTTSGWSPSCVVRSYVSKEDTGIAVISSQISRHALSTWRWEEMSVLVVDGKATAL